MGLLQGFFTPTEGHLAAHACTHVQQEIITKYRISRRIVRIFCGNRPLANKKPSAPDILLLRDSVTNFTAESQKRIKTEFTLRVKIRTKFLDDKPAPHLHKCV